MNLSEIIKNLNIISISGDADLDISDIVYDSRKVKENTLFVCLRGCGCDGHDFINDAISKGARVILSEKKLEIPGTTVVEVKDTREALAYASSNFFEHPYNKLTTIAITGTKGKTTTSHMIKSILETSGEKVGLIGTLGLVIGEKCEPLNNTTPESYEVQKCLSKMVKAGCRFAVIEASSIGLARHRLDGIDFDFGIFTNISNDHIGQNEHKDFQEYLKSKSLLFKQCKTAFVNKDDEHYKEIISGSKCKIEFFGMSSSDYTAKNLHLLNSNGVMGVNFDIEGKIKLNNIFVSIPGKFNVYNALAAIAVSKTIGISNEDILSGLKNVKVKGRVESVPTNRDFSILIDYAHNALSMENVLNTLRKYNPSRLITLFGAGGNRPKIRRFEMGEVAGRLSDFSIVTSDNPRFEDPLEIIEDIKKGINPISNKYTVIPDRKEAIRYAINHAQKGDIILLAGKGHEVYQEIKGVKYHFDEREVVNTFLKDPCAKI